jgi:cell division septum initiation protein DivIVA
MKEQIEELKERIEELEQQLAYECGCNAELVDTQLENEELKKIIKENFIITSDTVVFKFDSYLPAMADKIKEFLKK